MVSSLNVSDPPTYIDQNRLVITEVDRQNNYLEVTYFGDDNGILEETITVNNVIGDSLIISGGTPFNSGETKETTCGRSVVWATRAGRGHGGCFCEGRHT